MAETPGAFDFIDSILKGDLGNAKGANVAKPEEDEEVMIIKSAADGQSRENEDAQIVGKPVDVKAKSEVPVLCNKTENEAGTGQVVWNEGKNNEDLLIFEKPVDVKTTGYKQEETMMFHEDSDDIVDAIEEIEVIDGMALLQEDVKDDSKEHDEVFIETGVEAGKPLPPSKRKKRKSGAQNSVLSFVENDLRISSKELMVGGPIPDDSLGKNDLIQRLRMFIHKLHSDLEKSEDKGNVLKKEYSKKMIEVKESEELVQHLTGRLTEQATAVREQMMEVQHARSERSSKKPSVKANNAMGFNEGIILPNELGQIAEGGMTDEQMARMLAQSEMNQGQVNSPASGKEDLFMSQQTLIGEILREDSFPGFTYKLTIKKPPLGFTLMKDEGAKFCKVEGISRNDLKKSGLVTGLQILSVNGIELENMTLQQVTNILKTQAMPVEIRMRRALTPWKQYTEFQTTSWGTKKAVTTWTFYCSNSKPRIVVLEHNQRKGKSKRKVLIDGEIRYERKSTQESFKFSVDDDVIHLEITKGRDALYSYTIRINDSSFDESMNNFVIARTEASQARHFV